MRLECFINLFFCLGLGLFVKISLSQSQSQSQSQNYPKQLHMAQGKDYSSMVISWITDSDSNTNILYGQGPNKNNYKFIDSGEIVKYNFNYPPMPNYTSGYIHHVYLNNLEPESTYFFECGDFEKKTTTKSHFTTLQKPGISSKIKPLVFGVIGDIGQTDDSKSTLAHLESDKVVQMILHAGDLSYADCDQTRWDSYGTLIEPVSKSKAWMVGPGNHEIEIGANNPNSNSNSNPYLAFESRYKMPSVKNVTYGKITLNSSINPNTGMVYCTPSTFQSEYDFGNSFYSFDAGLVHVIFLNPYTTTDINSPQYNWIISDLELVDRKKTPWIIIVMHCPWYNSNKAHQNEKQTLLMRETFEPVFYKYKVNLIFTGHVHAYERTYPVYMDTVLSDAPTYIVIGDGGNNEGHASTYLTQPKWSAYRNGTQYGYGLLTIKDMNQIHWRWFRNIDLKLVSQDEVIIYNNIN